MQILLDGLDILRLNRRWMRSHIGLVSQEPVLFAGTVAQNIAFGMDGKAEEGAIEAAARAANAHDFIAASPAGYATQVVWYIHMCIWQSVTFKGCCLANSIPASYQLSLQTGLVLYPVASLHDLHAERKACAPSVQRFPCSYAKRCASAATSRSSICTDGP